MVSLALENTVHDMQSAISRVWYGVLEVRLEGWVYP